MCLTLGLFLQQQALAQTDAGRPPYRDADWALLPEWCIDTQDGPYGSPSFGAYPLGRNKSPRSDRWVAIFGGDFWHMHHACRARYFARQLTRAVTPADRIAAINRVIGEYQYVILKASEANPLLPEIYYLQAEMYLRKQDRGAASAVLGEARRLKPDYWPAYTLWADELINLRLPEQAAELIAVGLSHMPDNPELLERKRKLEQRRIPVRTLPPAAASAASAAGQ